MFFQDATFLIWPYVPSLWPLTLGELLLGDVKVDGNTWHHSPRTHTNWILWAITCFIVFTWLFWNNFVYVESLGLGRVFHQPSVLLANVSIGIWSFLLSSPNISKQVLCSYAMSQKIQKWHYPRNHSFVQCECDGSVTPISTVESQKSNYLERHFCRKQRAALGCGTFPWIPYHVSKLVCWNSINFWWDMIVKPMAEDGAPMNSSWWKTVFWCLSSMTTYVHQIWFW